MTLEAVAAAVLLIEFAVVPPMVLPETVAVAETQVGSDSLKADRSR